MWTYHATVDRVVHGDTLDLSVDLGFRTFTRIRIRLKGVDTPEVYGVRRDSEEYELGIEASRLVQAWVDDHEADGFIIKTEKHLGKYGRWIGVLTPRTPGAVSLNETLASMGFAFDGGGE